MTIKARKSDQCVISHYIHLHRQVGNEPSALVSETNEVRRTPHALMRWTSVVSLWLINLLCT